MVRVRTFVLTLAALAVAVRADAKASQTDGGATCVAPETLASYEAKIDLLETEREKWQSQLVAANGQWNKEKSELQAQLEAEKSHAKSALASSKKTAAKLEKEHAATLDKLQSQVATLEKTVQELKTQLEKQKETLGKREAEVSDAKAKLLKSQDQVKSLERDVASSRKKNEALRDELQKMDEKLTISALLSSYYDEGVVLASDAVAALRVQLESAQQGSAGVAQALDALEAYKKQVTDVSSQLYADHLAATLDPLIADLHKASQPYIKQYRPLLEAEIVRLQKLSVQYYNLALKRGKAVRRDAIAVLKQNESTAPYAQKIVDGSLIVLAAPIALLLLRLVLSLTWFVIRTVLCILTLGFCCGRCARKRSKSKRKASRKLAANGAPPSPTATPSTAKTPATSTNGKRATGKKQK